MIALKSSNELIGPWANGVLLTPKEFDRSRFQRGWRYELINGVLVVSPSPLENQRDPNEELGRWLRNYQEGHPLGKALDATLPEHTARTLDNRRTVDRAIWTGLGRLPGAAIFQRSWRSSFPKESGMFCAIIRPSATNSWPAAWMSIGSSTASRER